MESKEHKNIIKQRIEELEKELKTLRLLDNSHLDFSKLNNVSRYAFSTISLDFRRIVTSIHFIMCNRKNICGDDVVDLKKYRNSKMRELTKEQIQESNELLQKMLEPYVEKIKEKIALLKGE